MIYGNSIQPYGKTGQERKFILIFIIKRRKTFLKINNAPCHL